MYKTYEVQVETPMGAFLNVVTTAVTESDARKNVAKMIGSFVTSGNKNAHNENAANSIVRLVSIRVI